MIFWYDILDFIEASTLLSNGINPYETSREFFYKYPPLFFYLLSFFGSWTGFSFLGPKVMIFSFDLINLIVIYKIGILLKNRKFGNSITFYYAFNPLILLQFYSDVNEFVTLCFTLLSIYWLLADRKILSAVSLSCGIGFKLYPVFLLIPITIYLYKNLNEKKIFEIFKLYLIVILTFVLISLPFLIISPTSFINKLFIHTSRMNIGGSITDQIPALLNLFNIAFEIFGIQFSYQFIIQFIVIFIIIVLFYFSKKEFNHYDLFTSFIVITLVLSFLSYQIQLKYFNLIAFPFLLFLIKNKLKEVSEIKVILFFLMNLLSILIFLILFIIFFPPISNLLRMYEIYGGAVYNPFAIILFIIIVIDEYRDKEKGDYLAHLLNILPIVIYNMLDNAISAIIAMGIVFINIGYILHKYWYNSSNISKIGILS